MVFFVLVLAAAVATLALCAPLRLRVEDVLFSRAREETVAQHPAEAPAHTASGPREALGQPALDVGELVGEPAPAADAPPEGAAPAAEPVGPAAAQERAPSPEPSQSPVAEGPLKPWQRVVMPPALRQVQFGMPSEQISRGYPVAWTKEELGELMLTHYHDPDKTKTVRFHFSGDSLYRIEVRLQPAGDQSRKDLYDVLRGQYEQLYARVPEKSATRWSDGTVTAQIKLIKDGVELIFVCPAARR